METGSTTGPRGRMNGAIVRANANVNVSRAFADSCSSTSSICLAPDFRGLMKDVVKVRVNQAGVVMIVVVAGVDVLERRQAQSLHQSQAYL